MKLMIALIVLCLLSGCISEYASSGEEAKTVAFKAKEKKSRVTRKAQTLMKSQYKDCSAEGLFMVCPGSNGKKVSYSVIVEEGVNADTPPVKVCKDKNNKKYLSAQLPDLNCKLIESKHIPANDPDVNTCINGLSNNGCYTCTYSCV
ncbi:hypothetical protein ACFLRF_04105 [Candidatus Altiarchaeota archaeon]